MKKNDELPLFEKHGGIWPMDIPTSLSWNEIGMLLHVIHVFHVTTFIEIGIDQGGLAAVMMAREMFDDEFHYYGIEVDGYKISGRVMARNLDKYTGEEMVTPIRIDDVFSHESLSWIRDRLVNSRGTALVLCDGGDKPGEMRFISPLLRTGDVIMAHDFGDEIFENDLSMRWLERLHYVGLESTRLVMAERK